MRIFLTVILAMFLGNTLFAQIKTTSSKPTKQESSPEPNQKPVAENQTVLPIAKQTFRPKLTLQNALKLAESYIEKEKFDLSSFYLYQAKFILYGEKESRKPAWYFWWLNETGALGNYVEILVLIDTGQVSRLPSM